MTSTQPEPQPGNGFVRFLRDSFTLTLILEALFGVLTAIAGAFVGNILPFVIFLICAVGVQVLERVRAHRSRLKAKELGDRITTLAGEVEEARINAVGARAETQELVTAIRRSAQKALQRIADMHDMNGRDRLTLYQVVEDGLAIVARYSQDTELRKISPETYASRFPPTHGLIGRRVPALLRQDHAVHGGRHPDRLTGDGVALEDRQPDQKSPSP